jgi:predicted ATPase
MTDSHPPSDARAVPLIVITGGPGAGKTAVLEVVRKHSNGHVVVLPEAASIVFGGGFPRKATDAARRAAQRAIFAVQRELEALAIEEDGAKIVLCDRGTLDGLAYWPGDGDELLSGMGTTREKELARYDLVLHLRTPPPDHYDRQSNPLRVESALEALGIDERIAAAWEGHPRRLFLEHSEEFLDKIKHALAILRGEVHRRFPPVAEALDGVEPDGA